MDTTSDAKDDSAVMARLLFLSVEAKGDRALWESGDRVLAATGESVVAATGERVRVEAGEIALGGCGDRERALAEDGDKARLEGGDSALKVLAVGGCSFPTMRWLWLGNELALVFVSP